MKRKSKAKFHKKKGFCTVPARAKDLKKLHEVKEMRILDLEGRWIMTFQKVDAPPDSLLWEAETYVAKEYPSKLGKDKE